jgi:putative endonuclease
MRQYFVYILASRSRTLYVGVTNDLGRRLVDHRNGDGSRFVRKYRIDRLAYVESTDDVAGAIAREKQIKGWRRERKVELVESLNPTWIDLASEWGIADPSLRSG